MQKMKIKELNWTVLNTDRMTANIQLHSQLQEKQKERGSCQALCEIIAKSVV